MLDVKTKRGKNLIELHETNKEEENIELENYMDTLDNVLDKLKEIEVIVRVLNIILKNVRQ
tara:strand:+ start:448 stop:630 length:183 start_codon:yes stop_codon:yes gene_type:complete